MRIKIEKEFKKPPAGVKTLKDWQDLAEVYDRAERAGEQNVQEVNPRPAQASRYAMPQPQKQAQAATVLQRAPSQPPQITRSTTPIPQIKKEEQPLCWVCGSDQHLSSFHKSNISLKALEALGAQLQYGLKDGNGGHHALR